MRSICSQWLGYSWMCPLLPCLAAHQTGSELPRITVQRSEVRRPHSAHWRCLCSTQIQHIWSNCSSAYWHWLLLWSSQDLQPNTEHLSKYYYCVGWFVFQSTFWSCSLWAEPSGQGAASRFKIQCFLWSSLRSPAAGAGTQRSAARNNNITKLGDEPSREGRKFRVSNFSLIRLQEPICFGCININLR